VIPSDLQDSMEDTMPWTETTRAQYRRDGLRYASDVTDREWALIEPLLPAPSRLGRPRRWQRRLIVDAILYVLATGCQWRALPKDLPPRSTVQGYFYRWRDDGTWPWINARLVARARQALGRNIAPSAGIIDSQSAPTTESGGPRGLDAGKRVKGRKRHIVTDTQGFLIAVLVHAANIQDCHGAVPLLRALRRGFPKLRHIFADRVYRGAQLPGALADCGPWTIDIVQRPPGVKGFQLLPRRWVVERTFAWLGRSRRLAKDVEATIASATAWLLLASIRLLSRRLARL
jgi:putative transposase